MKIKMKTKSFSVLIFCFFMLSCDISGNDNLPYLIDGAMTMEASVDYEIAGFDFLFLNRSNKTVREFTMVFYVFDQDGNPPVTGKNNIVYSVTSNILPGKSLQSCISMDSFLYEIPEEPYEVDYLYVSRIEYDDGSVWTDPFGLKIF